VADSAAAVAGEPAVAGKAVIVAVLRQVATWVETDSDTTLFLDIATRIEAEDLPSSVCCPMCEEVVCDTDCVLAPLRSAGAAPDQPTVSPPGAAGTGG
jgi:hypothetical protein